MRFLRFRGSVATAALLLAPLTATAQAPAPSRFGIVLDLGFVSSSGNTDVTTFSLGEKASWKPNDRWSFAQLVRSVYGQTGDSVTANSLNAGISADYSFLGFVKGIGLTAGATYERNEFSGIERRTEQSLGLVWRGATASADSLRIDAGAVATQQVGVDDSDDSFVSARAGLWYKRPIGAGAYFQQTIEALPNLETSEDWRVNSETALVAPISARIGLKLSYVVRYDNLPQPTFEKSDRILTAGVQITR
jgi:putative salt-induced outer membrane protein